MRLSAHRAEAGCSRSSRREVLGRPISYRFGTPGRHVAMNSLSVLAAAHALGADLGLAAPGSRRSETAGRARASGRGSESSEGEALLIDESYNANPASMRAALATLGGLEMEAGGGRRIAVLGDMLELGPEGPSLHRDLATTCRGATASISSSPPGH